MTFTQLKYCSFNSPEGITACFTLTSSHLRLEAIMDIFDISVPYSPLAISITAKRIFTDNASKGHLPIEKLFRKTHENPPDCGNSDTEVRCL